MATEDRKWTYKTSIMELLGATYMPGSRPHIITKKALGKLSLQELDALYALVLSSTKTNKGKE